MNNNITEDYCSFEVSKLLKEKGFLNPCSHYFDEDGSERRIEDQSDYSKMFHKLPDEGSGIYQPTHSLAIKWIRENFKISIEVDNDGYPLFKWIWIIQRLQDEFKYNVIEGDFYINYEEATEAALLYTLKNLI